MPWFKVDDQLATHPKVVAAGNAAMGLWARAGSWSAQQLTDGHIPAAMVAVLGGRPADARKLVQVGLWDIAGDGYRFHDWEEYQPTRGVVEAQRSNRSSSATLANHKRWHAKRGVTDLSCPHCRSSPRAAAEGDQ